MYIAKTNTPDLDISVNYVQFKCVANDFCVT